MVFPVDPLPLALELLIDGVWVDVVELGDLREVGHEVTVRRGRADETADTDTGHATFTVDNTAGQYTPGNPRSPHYPHLKLNLPVRCSVAQGARYLDVPGGPGTESTNVGLSTPDTAALDITGDIDLRVDLDLSTWKTHDELAQAIISKYLSTTDQRSWYLMIDPDGRLRFRWSTLGTQASLVTVVSTQPLPVNTLRRKTLRVTLDVNSGGTAHVVTFYLGDSLTGPWTTFETFTGAGTTSIFSGSAPVHIGASSGLSGEQGFAGRLHGASIRNGIGGTEVGNPNLSLPAAGVASFADAAGRTWTLQGDAEVTSRRWRFHHELASLPTSWDPSGSDVTASAEATGILRRTRAGQEPLDSPLYRYLSHAHPNVRQYWPAEEVVPSANKLGRFASGVGGPSLFISRNPPNLGAFDGFAASSPLPQLDGDQWIGEIGSHPTSTTYALRWLMRIVDASVNGQTIVEMETTNAIYQVAYETGGNLNLKILSGDAGATLTDRTGLFSGIGGLIGKSVLMSLEVRPSGSDIAWRLSAQEYANGVVTTATGTETSRSVRRVERVIVSPNGGLDDIVIGHIWFETNHTNLASYPDGYWHDVLHGWDGEPAGRRAKRLAAEEGLAFRSIGDLDDTVPMGPQRSLTLYELLAECVRTDQGLLYEPVDAVAVGFRTRASLALQESLTLDYAAGHLSPPLQPVYDDQRIQNDVTVTDASGAFSRSTERTGPLSIDEPPDGIGRYDHDVQVNVADTGYLGQLASLIRHYGTQDLMRYPSVTVALNRAPFVADPVLTSAILDLRPGDHIEIVNLPDWLPGSIASLLVEGWQSEVLANFTHELTLTCSPEDAHRIGVYDDDGSRYDADTPLAEDLTTTETDVSVDVSGGVAWVTSAAEYPFEVMVGGEVMNATAAAAPSGGTQVLTVTRSVNGVVKTHATGAVLSLAQPVYYDL